jgi:hypothetical protein
MFMQDDYLAGTGTITCGGTASEILLRNTRVCILYALHATGEFNFPCVIRYSPLSSLETDNMLQHAFPIFFCTIPLFEIDE